MKKILLFILIIFSSLLFISCNSKEDCDVVTSFYTINELTTNLTKGTNIKVHNLIDSTQEPHDYSPSNKEVALLNDTKLIIFNGNDLEEFEKDLPQNIKNKIFYASSNVEPIKVNQANDPHTFVSIKSNILMLENIKNKLVELFEDSKSIINENYDNYKASLTELDNEYKQVFSNINYTIVTGHNAYNYVARDYNVSFKPIRGLHEEEISEKGLATIIDYIKENNITIIYGEYYEENDSIEYIASQTNSTIKLLYTGERMGEENYSLIDMHKQNIKTLSTKD